jgi:hypothetical protein
MNKNIQKHFKNNCSKCLKKFLNKKTLVTILQKIWKWNVLNFLKYKP